jgi:mannose/fructose/N-acetylgalactosamine-specific phosphotransferase system component IIB
MIINSFSICKSILMQINDDDEEYNKNIEIMKLYMTQEFGSVMSSMVPEINIYLGEQKEVSTLTRMEEVQKRLFDSFITFFSCFTIKKQLILVIDDLQWADSASLAFLEKLLSIKDDKIFIIGAYRDNEVDENHPLMRIIEKYTNIKTIHLKPLELEYLNEMIAETLLLPEKEIYELGELIHTKTLGNPFFSREFIMTLYEESLIFMENEKWNWNLETVKNLNFSSNVIDFMVKNLKKESKTMQKVLTLASCLGNKFSTNELSLIWNEKDGSLTTALLEPINNGWITQLSSFEYQFCHDRLQQASYELFSEEERKQNHFIIGSALLKSFKDKNILKERIFKVVNHLNNASSIFEDNNELLQLNVKAANHCLQNSAVKSAHEFALIAVSLLEEDHWENNYDNSFLAYSILADTYYRVSDLKKSDETFILILENVKYRIQRLVTYSNYMKMLSLTIQFDKGFYILLDTFKMFEITKEVPNIYTDMKVLMGWIFGLKKKIDDTFAQLGGIENLDQKLVCDDEEIKIFQKILSEAGDLLYITSKSNPLLTASVPLVSVHLFLTHGLTDYAPCGFSIAAWYFSCFFKDPNGYQMTLFVEKIIQKMKGIAPYNVSLVEFTIGLNSIFGGTYKTSTYHLEEAIKYSLSNSEYIFGSYSMNNLSMLNALNGSYTPTLIQSVRKNQHVNINLF